jgi:hypothetical protein
MTGKDKIQYLLITYLLNKGSIELQLPDGIELAIGITQEGKHGIFKNEDYCWITTSRGCMSTELDCYNLGLKFSEDKSIILDVDKEEELQTLNIF